MARHEFTQQERAKAQDISNNTRAKLVASLKSKLSAMTGDITREIETLNSEGARPINLVNDLAGKSMGADYLQAPENLSSEDSWPVQLGRLLQDVKQLERRILRAERTASQKAA